MSVNVFITTTKENFDKFSEYGNPHGIYFCIYNGSFISIEEKEDLTRKVYDIIFNNKLTGTRLDDFVKDYYFDNEYYNALEDQAFSTFMNDMCFTESHLYDMIGGESEDYSFTGSDGIKSVTMCRLASDYSVESPMIMYIASVNDE